MFIASRITPVISRRAPLAATIRAIAGGALIACAAPLTALAQADYPNRPIRIIVPYAPGGTDQQLRLLAPALQKLIGQALVIENIAGAGAAIGTAHVRNAKPDGYTLLYTGTGALTVAPNIGKTPYAMDDLLPVGNVIGTPFVVAAKPDAPFKTLAAMVAYGKANPEKISFGSAGHGTTTHMAGEAIAGAGGFKLLHVPYQGGHGNSSEVESRTLTATACARQTWKPSIDMTVRIKYRMRAAASITQKE